MTNTNKNWLDLLVNQTEDITTAPIFPAILANAIFASGNFDGATVQIQVSPDDVMNTDLYPTPDDATWFTQVSGTFTAETYTNCDLAEAWVRVAVTNSGEATDVSLKLRPRNYFSIS